ncbi:MAG: restriction endonuclease subunit S [Lewinellaceae bacterium]|nr:restriction endonuclease subunit S [Phaeodactylibacter sp.]MCB9347597.1 restriction endonuclease subunit S [Lewinellaceae bacterium]
MAADRIPEGFQQTEVGVIPGDWDCLPISEIFDFKQGIQCPVENQYKIDRPDLKRFIRIVDLTQKDEPARYILDPGSSHHVDRDDLFMVRYGSPGLLGYGYKGVIANNLFRLVPKKKLVNQFYLHLLTQKRSEIIGVSGSSTMPAINFSTLRTLYLIAPSIAEQTAIAAALSDMDALIESLERLIGKKQAMKQGAMQELLTGKRRLAGFGAGKGMRRTEVGVVPGDWEVTTLANCCSLSKKRINPQSSEEVYKCVELEHISSETGRLIDISDTKNLKSLKAVFQKGDTLFGKLRPYLRKYLFAEFDGVCSTEIWVLKPNERIHDKWLYYVIQTDRIIDAANQSEGTKMPRADWALVSSTTIPLPQTLAEQRAIARTLSDMDAEIGQLEAQLAKYRRVKEGMMQELLTGKKRLV